MSCDRGGNKRRYRSARRTDRLMAVALRRLTAAAMRSTGGGEAEVLGGVVVDGAPVDATRIRHLAYAASGL